MMTAFFEHIKVRCFFTEIKCRISKFFSEKSKMFSENNFVKRHLFSRNFHVSTLSYESIIYN